jgi:ATP adenylyltransferase
MEKSKFLDLENARTPEQKKLMEKIIADGVCPFCSEHFKNYHPKPVLKETDYWFFTENISPYEGTKYHFIFVYKPGHIETPVELQTEAIVDLFALVTSAIDEYKIPGGSFFMRFGEGRYTGGSVQHLHAHLLMGDADAEGHAPVRVKLG